MSFQFWHISVFYMSFSNVYVILWLCYAFAEGAFAEGEQVHVWTYQHQYYNLPTPNPLCERC